MTGRGHSLKGVAHSNPDSSSDSRRGRGRGTRRSQLPTTSHADEQSEEHEFREDEDPEFLNEDHEDDTLVEGDDRSDMDKIKQIQQQKMMIVTPMAQKRTRGRPPRQRTSSQAQMPDDLMDEELMSQDLLESGPLEGPGSSDRKPAPPVLVGRGSRARNAPKKLNDFVQHHQLANKKMQIQEISIPLPLAPNAGIEDNIEPLIPNDAHIEEVRHEVVEKDVVKSVIERDRDEDQEQEHASVADPAGPPPAPAHLANKANSRGRPANPIPPHRRPVPKDLVPPGFPSLKRASSQRDPTPIKRKDTREVAEKVQESHRDPEPNDAPPSPLSMSEVPIAAHQVEIEDEVVQSGSPIDIVTEVESNDGPPPMPPMLLQQQSSQASSSTVPSASQGVTVPSTALDATKKKEREAGKDLPSEHFPKEKARHVSTRGLHPYVSDKSHIYDVRDQVLIHPEDMEQQEQDAIAQQRVLTLQGGNFIEDRIGRSDLMEDEEMKMMKSIQPQQYIVEENGMNVVYEVDPNSVIEEEEQVEIQAAEQQAEQYVMDEHSKQGEMEDEEDDDLPPQLVPEGVPEDAVGDDERDEQSQEKGLAVDEDGNFDFNMMDEGEMIRLQSPGGRAHEVRFARDVHGNSVFIDENGHIVELVTDTGALVEPHNMVEQEQQVMQEEVEQEDVKNKQQIRQHQQQQQQEVPGGQEGAGPVDRGNLEFSFLDTNNICCGLCGEIVVYDKLLTEHLPTAHPEYLSPGVELEEVPYDSWLKTRLKQESKMMENGFRHYDDHDGGGFGGAVRLYSKGIRQMRKVSQIRVNVNEMTLPQLEVALKRKLVEKMGRKVPVSLVDRLHARCDICQAVVSLNKKFEVIHLVRHFNAWHPAEHRCSQDWRDPGSATTSTSRRPLSLSDFSVVSTESADQNNLQCIWCGMMMDRSALGMHFSEVHAQQIAVPNCSLCLQEMVMTARLMEKYGEDFGISLPDEFHLQCSKLNAKYSSEKAMDKAIDRHLKRAKPGVDQHDPDDSHEDAEAICTTNSQQSFGRRNRLKRKFVKPCFRQICPNNSSYFEPKSACEWKCRLCNRNVYGAVISAGAIKHYKEFHPAETEHMQYELVKARLERIGDGSMEFVHPQLVECLICNLTYALHKPFNICRAIRHLRLKHPEVMPETAGKPISGAEISETTDLQTTIRRPNIRFGDTITDPIELERFRKDNFDQQFDKVQIVFGIKKNNEPAYILLMENEKMDLKMAQEMAGKVQTEEDTSQESRFDRLVGRDETPQFEESEPSTMFREETKPMALEFPQQIVEEEVEEMEEVPVETEFIPTYDANNPDHVLIDENEIMNDGNYEMIQEGEYQEIEEDRTVRYLTEDEIREAQARGEILEFEEGEYVEEYAVQQ